MSNKAPEYIYQGTPTGSTEIISLPTEQETINALVEAGGGIYRNVIHLYQFKVCACNICENKD